MKDNMIVLFGLLVAFGLGYSVSSYIRQRRERHDRLRLQQTEDLPSSKYQSIVADVVGLIGNTPLLHLRALSEETGCTILVRGFSFFLFLFVSLTQRVLKQTNKKLGESGIFESRWQREGQSRQRDLEGRRGLWKVKERWLDRGRHCG